jgi:hypothetical protein
MSRAQGSTVGLARSLFCAAAVVLAGGCELPRLGYDGPRPDKKPLVNEVVILRTISAAGASTPGFFADRVKYLAGHDPHNINRVVFVWLGAHENAFSELGLGVGDSARIATRYETTYFIGAPESVPDWPGHTHYETPVAFHTLTAIEPIGD